MSEQEAVAAEDSVAPDACALCGTSLEGVRAVRIGGHPTCPACVDQIHEEIAEGEARPTDLPAAAAGALVGAGLGAAVWAGIVVATEFEIGYVAVLVGFLAGKGATLGAGGRHGRPLQVVAVAGSLLGLLAAKYAILAYLLRDYVLQETGETLGWFAPETLLAFPGFLAEMSNLFDLLWIFIAVTAAWRVPASPRLVPERG